MTRDADTDDDDGLHDETIRPRKRIHRALLHTPCPLLGGYGGGDPAATLTLDIAWPQDRDAVRELNHFVLSLVRASEREMGDLRVREPWDWLAVHCANLMSLAYGKRVEFLGMISSGGTFAVTRSASSDFGFPAHPFISNRPRVDRAPCPADRKDTFNLAAADTILWVLDELQNERVWPLLTATDFYAHALRSYRSDPDSAYLSLVTAGEILADAEQPDPEPFFGEQAREFLEALQAAQVDEKWQTYARKNLFAATARFVGVLRDALDDEFFERTEAHTDTPPFRITKDKIEKALRATYGVRSLLSHAGIRISNWLHADQFYEVPIGRPVMRDQRAAKALESCLTILGLERVIRYALLRAFDAVRSKPE